MSEYVDARIEYGDKVIIVENKVKDAIDQDEQIDRYVKSALQNHRAADIYVIYLTRDGEKKVQDYSFNDTKTVLEYEGEDRPGRFILLNYRDDIVGWLENDVAFSVSDLQHQPYLRSGIEQYLHYIQGPELLGTHNESDPYKDLQNAFAHDVEVHGLDLSVNALAELYKDSIVSSSPADRRLVELFRSVVRQKFGEMDGHGVEYWDQLDCVGWGTVDHWYWWRSSGFALQLCENFAIEHAVRALELFPRRGVDVGDGLRTSFAALLPNHPYFTYQWNGRAVYKFPVPEKNEAQALAADLWRMIEESSFAKE